FSGIIHSDNSFPFGPMSHTLNGEGSRSIMFCIQCGSYNPDNAAFCGKCGEKLNKGTSTPPSMSVEGVPASSGAQSPAGEYIPTIQEMPTASSFPVSQGSPPINDITQTGYGISQS